MKRRPRTRRILKWVGLAGCVLILASWLLSYVMAIRYMRPDWHISLSKGHVVFKEYNWWRPNRRLFPLGWQTDSPFDASLRPDPRYTADFYNLWIVRHYKSTSWNTTAVSLWLPLLFVAIPAAVLWHRDRRPPPGHCKSCGYDLTGNVSGVCPECGQPCATDSS